MEETTMKFLFEQLRGTYSKQSDYPIPNLTLSKSEKNDIGIYGERHLQYLQKYRKLTYINLLTSGVLNEYLSEIDKQAQKRFCRIRIALPKSGIPTPTPAFFMAQAIPTY